jgi:sulfur carrier protein ThiS
MKDRINNTRRGDDSYLAVSRRKRRRYIMIIAIPVAVAAVILGVVFATQASERGTGTGAQMGSGDKMVLHIHPKLNVKVDGKNMTVQKDIGINPALWKDHSLDKYGMQGMAPLHTHDNSGVVHVESNVKRDYTLGEFLNIWGIDLNGKSVKVSVNDQPVSDWRNHILSNGEQINLEISG